MTVTLFLVALLAESMGSPHCFATAREVPANAALVAEDLIPVDCREGSVRPALRYDRSGGGIVTASALPAGVYLGRLAPLPGRQIPRGAVLTLRSAIGPVVIEREVTAMQPGRSGGRVFVRDAAGQVFAAPLDVQ